MPEYGYYLQRLKLLAVVKPWIVFLNDGKKAKYLLLAPIAVKILVNRGSVHKIVTESGSILAENA
ncbi:hypothetical protein CLU83_0072 [Flavobacterium sp. 1]|uniref:hypothetical protein n=1 Tax=Flavobacterium sp. 1 TaxID=2035200 RepID=UPI000C246CB9|nr:hypothetical protein [Flavobacterium sp. 1]PJJ06951.1 hypothetical protein CLU83_0072 [Flavobacterium sp. 1]